MSSLLKPPKSQANVSSSTGDVTVVFLARASVIIGQLAYIKLYSNYLSHYELGIYFYLITVSYSLNALIFVPVDYYQQSKIYECLKNGVSLRSFLVLNKKIFYWVGIAAIIGFSLFIFVRPRESIYFVLIIITAVALYISQALRGGLNNLEHKRIAAISLILEALLKIALLIVLLRFMAPNAIALIASWIIAMVLVAGFLGWHFIKLGVFSKGGDTLVQISAADVFRFAYPISISAIFNWIQLQGYRLVLVPLGFAEMVGLYAIIENIGKAGMGACSSVFGQMFVPNIYKSSGKYTGTYLRNALLLIAVVFFFSLAFSDAIVSIVTNGTYAKYSWILLLGVVAEAANFLLGALVIHTTLTSSTKPMLSASIVGVGSMVAIFGGIYYGGVVTVQSIGIPIVISQIIALVYMYWVFRKSNLNQGKGLDKC